MKKILIATLLILFSSSVNAELVEVDNGSIFGDRFYIDLNNIKTSTICVYF